MSSVAITVGLAGVPRPATLSIPSAPSGPSTPTSPTSPTIATLFETVNGGIPQWSGWPLVGVSEADATFADGHGWQIQNDPEGAIAFTADGAVFPASSLLQAVRLNLASTIPAGTRVRTWLQVTTEAGKARMRVHSDVGTYVGNGSGWYTEDLTLTNNASRIDILIQGGSGAMTVHKAWVEIVDPAAQDYDVIILAGQSNMAGTSSGALPDPGIDLPHPRIDVMSAAQTAVYATTDGGIGGAVPPLQHRRSNTNGMGPGLSFARWYADNVLAAGRRLLLVAVAEGGTSLSSGAQDWAKATGTLYPDMIARAQTALALGGQNAVTAVYWSQGETDTGVGAETTHAAALRQLIADIRTDLSVADLPFVISGLNPNANADLSSIMAAHEDVGGDLNVVYSPWRIDWPDGTKDPVDPDFPGDDTVHFSTAANRLRGAQAAADAAADGVWSA